MSYRNVIVAAFVIIAVLSVALAGPVVSFFIPVMHAELGIPLLYFGIALSARQLCFAIVSPVLGRWIDRYGARPILVIVGICAGVIVWMLSYVTTGWQLVVLLGLLGLLGLQGAGGELYGSVVIAKWFQENRGRAMSIIFIGTPVGIFFLMPLAQYMIDTLSWQTTWQIFGICGGVLLVFTALLLRPAPAIKVTQTDSELTPAYVHQWTRAEVLRSVTFWKLAVSFGILMFSISTVAMFRVPFFIEQGLSAKWVALAFSSEAVVSALVAIPVGLLIERYQIHHLTAIGFAFAIIMLLLTIYTDTLVELFLATAVFGMGAASVIILQNTIWPTYFGSQHIGAIRGVAMPVTLGFAVMGAPIAGWVRDTTGSFVPIWWATIAAMIVAIILILTTPKPADPEQ